MIISSVNQGLSGQIFVSGIIVDNGDGAFGPDILIVFGDVILGISDIDVDVAVMMTVYLVVIGDDLAASWALPAMLVTATGSSIFK